MQLSEWFVEYYALPSGLSPFREWRVGITDVRTKAAVDARVARMRGGNFGNSRPIGGGASESRIDFGPGFRIYYGRDGRKIILLDGGDKSTQSADIANALGFWNDYKKQKAAMGAKVKLQERSAQRPKKR
jgi:putative addiction module killer protein